MDIAFVVQKLQKKTERFDQEDIQSQPNIHPLALLVSMVAVYLSWNCNSAEGRGLWERVVYAFFAFIFGGLYVGYYLLFRENWCRIAFLRQ